ARDDDLLLDVCRSDRLRQSRHLRRPHVADQQQPCRTYAAHGQESVQQMNQALLLTQLAAEAENSLLLSNPQPRAHGESLVRRRIESVRIDGVLQMNRVMAAAQRLCLPRQLA